MREELHMISEFSLDKLVFSPNIDRNATTSYPSTHLPAQPAVPHGPAAPPEVDALGRQPHEADTKGHRGSRDAAAAQVPALQGLRAHQHIPW